MSQLKFDILAFRTYNYLKLTFVLKTTKKFFSCHLNITNVDLVNQKWQHAKNFVQFSKDNTYMIQLILDRGGCVSVFCKWWCWWRQVVPNLVWCKLELLCMKFEFLLTFYIALLCIAHKYHCKIMKEMWWAKMSLKYKWK